MIRTEPIDALPAFDWSNLAALEMQEHGLDLIAQTDCMWKVGDVAVCGLIWESFYSPPWMWFALAKGARLRDLLDFRRLAHRIPHHTLTGIRDDRPEAIKFAELYGFRWTKQCVGAYLIYRKEL